ncbi:hypothetical protein SAMN05444411_1383 [Lutibacter oricola]|uniref:Uncharacterized protein n=1 Tax=Lutibacter oricola TaxID=762486 RepID=A0A1H3HGA7_9FLAO|nr:hypothetical protein [Lutibacter oricola]SDY14492.1 hypothetical protein SAMN05444411_1383 [Lutibacter oricola]
MKKIKSIIFLIILLAFSCKQTEKKNFEKNQPQIDSLNLNKKISESELNKFLENPIDLIEYKKNKKNWISTVTGNQPFYEKFKLRDSIFYEYTYPNEKLDLNRLDKIVVIKFRENKHTYNDETEKLIELNIFNKDSILRKANLVGLTNSQREIKFGKENLKIENEYIYFNENKLLILTIKNDKVDSYKYLRLNTDKIDKELIKQIKN